MSFSLSKKQIIILLILIGLILILPLTLFLVQQRQEIRKKAGGPTVPTGPIQVTLFSPTGNTRLKGDNFEIQAKLKNTATTAKKFRVAGVELLYDQNIFNILSSGARCGNALAIPAFATVASGRITLVCYVQPGTSGPSDPFSLQPNENVVMGSFQAEVKTTVQVPTSTEIRFDRTNIPDVDLVSLPNISDGGTTATFSIVSGITPTPTTTPTPIITPTPTPQHSPTPTATPIPGKGNLPFKVTFQTITSQSLRQNKRVRIILKQGGEEKYREIIGLASDTNGVYSGTATNINPGAYDIILVKGWAHLQKRYSTPLTINAGDNPTQDWSGIPLIVGDTYGTSPYGDEFGDNAITLEDLTAIISVWNQSSTPANDSNRKYDLDDNGYIQLEDLTAIISNWTTSTRQGDN